MPDEELEFNDDFDNDASASAFGWDFQVNAGIFLFLYYLKDASKIKIESRKQDVEITLKNNNKIYAQAKSSQLPIEAKNPKEKFKDAIVSISRNSAKNTKLMYVTNIENTFDGYNEHFDNKVIPYADAISFKKEIDKCIESKICSLERRINKEKSEEKKNKIRDLIYKIKSIDLQKFYYLTIAPYYGDSREVRYAVISDTTSRVLFEDVKLSITDAKCITNKLLDHWQNMFELNSTTKDSEINVNKTITKDQFLWPVVAFLIEDDFPDIEDSLSFQLDDYIINEAKTILCSDRSIYHERFEFSNNVIVKYIEFLKTEYVKNDLKPDKMFLKNKYKDFVDEFAYLNEDDELLEYITKIYMYKIINNRKVFDKVLGCVGDINDN